MSDMTPFQLYIYLCEVEMQCRYSLAAAESVNEYFERQRDSATAKPERAAEADAHRIQAHLFRSLHSFLTHAGVVSRLLWPSMPTKRRDEDRANYDLRKAQAVNRGKQVRLALGLPDEQPGGHRTLRDHLEHFDERLDEWVLTSRRNTFTDYCVGPPSLMFGLGRSDVMRWFDPTAGSFYFRGERFDLSALLTWVNEVRGRAEQARKSGVTTPPAAKSQL
jgi:hypothetical protein